MEQQPGPAAAVDHSPYWRPHPHRPNILSVGNRHGPLNGLRGHFAAVRLGAPRAAEHAGGLEQLVDNSIAVLELCSRFGHLLVVGGNQRGIYEQASDEAVFNASEGREPLIQLMDRVHSGVLQCPGIHSLPFQDTGCRPFVNIYRALIPHDPEQRAAQLNPHRHGQGGASREFAGTGDSGLHSNRARGFYTVLVVLSAQGTPRKLVLSHSGDGGGLAVYQLGAGLDAYLLTDHGNGKTNRNDADGGGHAEHGLHKRGKSVAATSLSYIFTVLAEVPLELGPQEAQAHALDTVAAALDKVRAELVGGGSLVASEPLQELPLLEWEAW